MSYRDDLILEEVERQTQIVLWVSNTLEQQDGRLMMLEATNYWRGAAIAAGAGLLGALLGGAVVWGVLHVG